MNDQLINEWNKLIGNMSHYNAAEGSSYWQEENERNECRVKLKATTKELINSGMSVDEIKQMAVGGLVSESDYL